MAVVGAEYILRMVPKGTHDVKKFIKPAELLSWVDETVLKEQHITGLHYNPITNTFKLGPGVDVNYMLHTRAKKPDIKEFSYTGCVRSSGATFPFDEEISIRSNFDFFL